VHHVDDNGSVADEVVLAGNERNHVVEDVDLGDSADDVNITQVTSVSVWRSISRSAVNFVVVPFEVSSSVFARVGSRSICVHVEAVLAIFETGWCGNSSSYSNLVTFVFESNLSAQISSSTDEIASVSDWFDRAAARSAASSAGGRRIVGWIVIVDVGVHDNGLVADEKHAGGIERDLGVGDVDRSGSDAVAVRGEDVRNVADVSVGVGICWSAVDLSSKTEMTASALALASFVVKWRSVGVNVESVVSSVPNFVSRRDRTGEGNAGICCSDVNGAIE